MPVLRNYLVRNGFAPNAVNGVILAYRETSDFVNVESASYISAVPALFKAPGDDRMNQVVERYSHQPETINVLMSKDNSRSLGKYDYEDGSTVRIIATGGVLTEDALDMVLVLVDLKRAELARAAKAAKTANSKDVDNETNA